MGRPENELNQDISEGALDRGEGLYPHEHRYYPGYERLLTILVTPYNIRNSLARNSNTYSTAEEIKIAAAKLEEIQKIIQGFFVSPETRDPLVLGLEKAMDLLKPEVYEPLALRYGLDNPQNTGKTFREVGELLPNYSTRRTSVTGEGARQKVVKAERQLRHPTRAKYYRNLLPDFQPDSG